MPQPAPDPSYALRPHVELLDYLSTVEKAQARLAELEGLKQRFAPLISVLNDDVHAWVGVERLINMREALQDANSPLRQGENILLLRSLRNDLTTTQPASVGVKLLPEDVSSALIDLLSLSSEVQQEIGMEYPGSIEMIVDGASPLLQLSDNIRGTAYLLIADPLEWLQKAAQNPNVVQPGTAAPAAALPAAPQHLSSAQNRGEFNLGGQAINVQFNFNNCASQFATSLLEENGRISDEGVGRQFKERGIETLLNGVILTDNSFKLAWVVAICSLCEKPLDCFSWCLASSIDRRASEELLRNAFLDLKGTRRVTPYKIALKGMQDNITARL